MEENYTDPKVVLDPSKEATDIATKYSSYSYNNVSNNEGMRDIANNQYDSLRLDGIEYPLIVINDRNIYFEDIIYMKLSFNNFLPELKLIIRDRQEYEQKINTSQMSGSVRLVITSSVDKVYRKIKLHFRILNVNISEYDHTQITYYCTYDVDKLREVNTGLIYKEDLKANTYEMLYKIASNCGLGFAATDKTEEIEDRLYRNIFTQRYVDYIKDQIESSGVDENSILDAWIDPYNYIVLTNVSWLLSEEVSLDSLSIVANVGFNGHTWDTPDNQPHKCMRILTNFSYMPSDNNLLIKTYTTNVENYSIYNGTLERIYNINFDENGISTIEPNDIQTKQDSVDGEYLEEYNTGTNNPVPKFNFNEDGYNLNLQKTIREHFFRKKRQSIFKITLSSVNLGLQRGTLVYVMIFEQDPQNKEILLSQNENLNGDTSIEKKSDKNNSENNDLVIEEGDQIPNMKLSDFYYIDGIEFTYSTEDKEILQSLYLIKKGAASGYDNKHTYPKITS